MPLYNSKSEKVEVKAIGLPDYYLEQARDRIQENFRISGKGYAGKIAMVEFTISANGTISDVRIVQSAGSAELDQLAKSALLETARLAPLPDSTGLQQVRSRVTFNFDR